MAFLMRYAQRNLRRNPARSALTLFAVVMSVTMLLVGHAVLTGLRGHVVSEFSKHTGHVRLRDSDYEREARFDPLDHVVEDWSALADRIRAVPGVARVTGRIHFRGMLQSTDESTIVPESAGIPEDQLTDEQIFGRKRLELAPGLAFVPSGERDSLKLHERLVGGADFSSDDAAEVLLGADLAARLAVRPGQTIQLVSHRKGVAGIDLVVVGIVRYGNRFYDRLAHVPLNTVQRLLDLEGAVTEVLVTGPGLDAAADLRETLVARGLISGLEVRIWSEIGMARVVSAIFDTVLGVLLFMILGVAGVNLLNTMMMTVLERQREIGTLMSLGLHRGRIVRLFLYEAGLYGVLGSALGAALGTVVAHLAQDYGIRLGAGATQRMLVPMGDTIHPEPTLRGLVLAVSVGVLVSLLGALWPALRASRVQPIDALRKT